MKSTRRNFFKTMGAGAAGIGLGSATLSLSSCMSSISSKEKGINVQ